VPGTGDVVVWLAHGRDGDASGLVEALRRRGIASRIHVGDSPPDGKADLVVRLSDSIAEEDAGLAERLASAGAARAMLLVAPQAASAGCRRAEGGARCVFLADRAWGDDALAALAELALECVRERAEREREKAYLDGLAEAQESFVAIASHDLRTPVSTLRLVLDLLRSGLAQVRTKQPGRIDIDELFEIMGRSLDKMDVFANDIIEAWRLYRGRPEVRPEPVSLNAVVEDIVAGMFPVAMQKDIALDLVKDQSLGPILAEPQRVGQVAANLIGNAIKYTPRGGSVKVLTRPEPGGAILEVSDTGPGIAESERDRLFQRFARGSARATGGEPSTGLGLFICREIVELYGGRIWFESEPGHGARFYVFWPGPRPEGSQARK